MNPVLWALAATIFTWGMTAAGAAMVFILPAEGGALQQKILDGLLGFAAGVMTAASFWSLLQPAIEMATITYGRRLAIIPVIFGFSLGGICMLASSIILGGHDSDPVIDFIRGRPADAASKKSDDAGSSSVPSNRSDDDVTTVPQTLRGGMNRRKQSTGTVSDVPGLTVSKLSRTNSDMEKGPPLSPRSVKPQTVAEQEAQARWRRVMLLVAAITIHNFPEGLAVGVGYGAVGGDSGTTLASAHSLAIGIGLQNFPEGLAVSMPLRREGMSYSQSFFWGQVSGMVEPLGGVIGAWAVLAVKPLLPYALSFAAGAMIYVVVDQLVPEAQSASRLVATIGFMSGFAVMMAMDVSL